MPNLTIQDLYGVLQKTGLPLQGSQQMQQSQLGAQDAIRQNVQYEDPMVAKQRANFRKQLDQIAQMDQKLSGVYGDPNSKLYIENPLQREKLQAGAAQTGYNQVQNTAQDVRSREANVEKVKNQIADETLSLYKQLTTMTAQEEKSARKATGVKSTKVSKAGSLLEFKDKETEKYFQSLQDTSFKRHYTQTVLEGPGGGPYDIEDLKGMYDGWKSAPSEIKTPFGYKPPKEEKSKTKNRF